MAATLAELLTAITVTEAKTLILALLEAVGFPATSWQRFSVPRTFVELMGELYSDSRTGITNIVKSRLLNLCEGDALDYLAENAYEISRTLATPTIGTFLLTDDGGAPYDIEIGQLIVRDTATNKRYINTTGGLLSANQTLAFTFQAEETGTGSNIGANSTLEFVETLEGVLVTNPAVGSTGTWVTTAGTDDQTDASLRAACSAQWSTLGAGTSDAYAAWALEGSPSVTKVDVYNDNPGEVRVVLATDVGGATEGERAAADAVIQAKRPIGLRVATVVSATAEPVVISATVYVKRDFVDGYEGRLAESLIEYQAALSSGEDLYQSNINALLHSPGGVTQAVVTSPVGTAVAPDYDYILVLSLGTITVVSV